MKILNFVLCILLVVGLWLNFTMDRINVKLLLDINSRQNSLIDSNQELIGRIIDTSGDVLDIVTKLSNKE